MPTALSTLGGRVGRRDEDGKPSGASRVERILDGCVIMENWSTVGRPYMGKSFNTYNPSDKTWTQHWVDTTAPRSS
jgi:hypothetical protein